MPVKEAIRSVVINEGVISQPLHGSAPGPGVPEGIPGGQQVGMLLVELVFEPAEGSLALDSARQPAPGWRASCVSAETRAIASNVSAETSSSAAR